MVAALITIGPTQYLPIPARHQHIHVDLGTHPSSQGGFRITVEHESGKISHAELEIGYVHRSAEKLFEVRDYRQILMLANRHDWVSPFGSELSVALAAESALGMVPTERATWQRMVFAEAGRISGSLAYLSFLDPTMLGLRERWLTWQEQAVGTRVHPMVNRIGGLSIALNDSLLRQAAELAHISVDVTSGLVIGADLQGVAPVGGADVVEFAASGPVAQASGVNADTRQQSPYLFYSQVPDELTRAAPTHAISGDAAARFDAMRGGISQSAAMIEVAAGNAIECSAQAISLKLPKTLRLPKGMHYAEVENVTGRHGAFIVSDGDKVPWRLKLRTPSFAHAQLLERALVGTHLDQMPAALASFFLVSGDIDR
ncbi:MAG: putative NADH-quinone oxidoreductase subunit [Actinomycetota bacterium]|jgi:NADH-quinone oxidoreductase subunit D